LIKESVKWGNLAHTLLQRYTHPGLTETEVSLRASMEATLCMLDTIGPIYRAQSPFSDGASVGYRGQIGRNAAIPHALASNIIFQEGDVLVTGASAPVWGYNSELERTMIIGPASDEQKRTFDHMLDLQETAFQAIKPGDLGDQTEISPGMVFTVEPGLYVPGSGGFRHSDTVLVTEGGIEMMTYYPRDLESLTIRV
jgi:Xaa-Pro aminopeptidase